MLTTPITPERNLLKPWHRSLSDAGEARKEVRHVSAG